MKSLLSHTDHSTIKQGIEFIERKDYLTPEETKPHTVVFVGPTGKGKSSMVNLLFNRAVADVSSSAISATRTCKIYQGKYSLPYTGLDNTSDDGQVSTVNVVDTIGFSDTRLDDKQVREIIESTIQGQEISIDRIVVVCADRIEAKHRDEIKKMLEWLNYKEHKQNFIFLYNKSDNLDDEVANQWRKI